MFKRLRIKDFKAWGDTQDIAMAPITLFFGGIARVNQALVSF